MLKRRLRFCLLTTFYPPYSFGGDAIFVQQLAHLLADQGHEVEVVHCRDAYQLLKAKSVGEVAAPEHPGVRVHTLRSGWGALSPVLTQATGLPWLKQGKLEEVLSQDFDVIHYHNISLLGGPGMLRLGRGLKLYTSHEYWLHCQTHLLLKWGREPCRTRHCSLCALSQGRPPQLWRSTNLMASSCRHVDLFFYPTEFGREQHLEAGLPGPVELLPNFVPDRRGPRQAGPRQDFLYVGRLEEFKGIEDLLPVFQGFPDYRLLVAGQGKQWETLRRRTRDMPNVELLGYLEPDQLRSLLPQARAVLVPSRCFELLPLVILEAFVHETPVVVSDLGELPRIAGDSGGGMVASDPQAWCEAIATLGEDDELVETMGRNGRLYYEQNCSPEAHLAQYLERIESLL